MNEVLELTILRGDRVQLVDIEFTKLFNVNGSSVSIGSVVELWIVLVNFGLLGVVESVSVV